MALNIRKKLRYVAEKIEEHTEFAFERHYGMGLTEDDIARYNQRNKSS